MEIDIDYLTWIFWLLSPWIAVFVLPALMLILLYMSSLALVINRHHRRKIIVALNQDPWHGCQSIACAIWDAASMIWHGYEVCGFENIPDEGGALLIFYHGALPIDIYYMVAKIYLYKNRLVRNVADRFVFKIPGWGPVLEAFKVIPGTIQSCTDILNEDNLLAIAPGGVYEALFGDHYYELLWKKRVGFARVALNAKSCTVKLDEAMELLANTARLHVVEHPDAMPKIDGVTLELRLTKPIIPIFTVNLRESFRTVQFLKPIWKWLYTLTRLPVVPIYGGFPVKLKTYVGEPIEYDGSLDPEELAAKVAAAVEKLRDDHQEIPGSIWRALRERF